MTTTAAKPAVAAPALHIQPRVHVSGRALVEQTSRWVDDNGPQIAVAAAIGLGLLLLLLAARRLLGRLVGADAAVTSLRAIVGRMAQRTRAWFLILLVLRLVDGFADAPPQLHRTIAFAFTIGSTIQFAYWARELLLGFVEYRAGIADHDTSALASALGLIRALVTFTIFALATVIVLDNLGVNVTGLVAGLGIGGIAIGLAAQGIFKDLFAALAIIFDRPFRQGDAVKWNNIPGTVERIGLKTTRIRALTGEQVIVGNANLLEKELYNLARLSKRRITFDLWLPSDTSAEACARVAALCRQVVDGVPRCALVRAGLTGFAPNGLHFEVQFDIASSNYDEVFAARSEVAVAVLRALAQARIAFAGPDGKALALPADTAAPAPAPAPSQPSGHGAGETAP